MNSSPRFRHKSPIWAASTTFPVTLDAWVQTTAFVYQQYGYGSTIAIFIMIECLFFSLIINKLLSKDNTI